MLDYIKLYTIADISLHKTDTFLLKYCKQAGTLPQVSTLCEVCVPFLYENLYLALTEVFKGKPVSITDDETTDIRDHSIVNVIATVRIMALCI